MGASGDKKTVDPNGKAAMERVGLFSEVGYISIGMNISNTPPGVFLTKIIWEFHF